MQVETVASGWLNEVTVLLFLTLKHAHPFPIFTDGYYIFLCIADLGSD
jgi:hypothetical protein